MNKGIIFAPNLSKLEFSTKLEQEAYVESGQGHSLHCNKQLQQHMCHFGQVAKSRLLELK